MEYARVVLGKIDLGRLNSVMLDYPAGDIPRELTKNLEVLIRYSESNRFYNDKTNQLFIAFIAQAKIFHTFNANNYSSIDDPNIDSLYALLKTWPDEKREELLEEEHTQIKHLIRCFTDLDRNFRSRFPSLYKLQIGNQK